MSKKSESIEQASARYTKAAHGMQSGVAWEQGRGSEDGSPKHLRTGINSAFATQAGLANLLIAKGVITYEEYVIAQADAMEDEVDRYEQRAAEAGFPELKFR